MQREGYFDQGYVGLSFWETWRFSYLILFCGCGLGIEVYIDATQTAFE